MSRPYCGVVRGIYAVISGTLARVGRHPDGFRLSLFVAISGSAVFAMLIVRGVWLWTPIAALVALLGLAPLGAAASELERVARATRAAQPTKEAFADRRAAAGPIPPAICISVLSWYVSAGIGVASVIAAARHAAVIAGGRAYAVGAAAVILLALAAACVVSGTRLLLRGDAAREAAQYLSILSGIVALSLTFGNHAVRPATGAWIAATALALAAALPSRGAARRWLKAMAEPSRAELTNGPGRDTGESR